ncbi:MAG: alpha/beta hydrolase [bacterium]
MDRKFLKRTIILLPFVILLSTCCLLAAEQTEANKKSAPGEERAWYEYDREAPLQDEILREEEQKGYKKVYFKFTDLQGDEVPGVMTLPTMAEGPFPVVVLMHGFMMQKEDFINQAFHVPFAKRGVATIAIDFPLHGDRPGDPQMGFDSLDGAESMFRQALFDVLRLFDYIEKSGELDAGRMGYIGVSMGAIVGSIAAGIDERVKVMAFLIGGGGLECLFTGIDMAGSKSLGDLAKNNPETLREKFEYFDQLAFAGRISPRPVLFYNVEDDPIIKKECAENFHNATGEPKEVIWRTAGGHYVNTNSKKVREPILKWFDEHLLDAKSEGKQQ